eukprot:7507411-Pyramimonas_sp.AAC.1
MCYAWLEQRAQAPPCIPELRDEEINCIPSADCLTLQAARRSALGCSGCLVRIVLASSLRLSGA